MSLLPQRKKSAEELNQLRDQLGISPQPAPSPSYAPQPVVRAPEPTPQPSPAPAPASPDPASLPAASPQPPPAAKPVRSLRRSEREPAHSRRQAQASPSPEFSRIPAYRHSNDQLAEIRRREALSQFNASGTPAIFPFPAPRWVIVPGYLLALAGFSCQYWKQEIPLTATAGTAALSLLIALYILLRRPLSRHHAGFIAIITLLALVFATLHYFPYLRHAS